MKTLLIPVIFVAPLLFSGAASPKTKTPKTSGIYLTSADYQNGKLAFEGDCKSKAHKLVLHDILNKPYIDVTHESQKQRYAKSDLFGFHACDGYDHRFASNLEYQILEARALYIYARDLTWRGKGSHTSRGYYFSVGPDGPVLELTRNNLKREFPDNQRFRDSLEATFGKRRNLAEYDKSHKMFTVNRLLIDSCEEKP